MMHRARLPLGFAGWMLCLVMALVGCETADNRSLPTVQVVPVHWEQATAADIVDSNQDSPAAAYLGSASCNTTGCHGSADLNAPAWRNAQAKQLFNDPHTQAFRVLYGERSARMFERLEIWPPADPGDKWSEFQKEYHQTADPAAREAVLTKNAEAYSTRYQQFLQQRCLGCHATPSQEPITSLPPKSNDEGKQDDGDWKGKLIAWQHTLSGGVTCESCHGPAGEWGATHFLPEFVKNRGNTAGFVDTKSLPARAQQCVGCHVGPMPYTANLGDSPAAKKVWHDMNHDLIAAGHPRLAFEFNAYWNALPAHWDPQKASRPLASNAGDNPAAYTHAQFWSVGQLAMLKQTIKLLNHRRDQKQVEFASYDCFDCHHELNEPSRRQFVMGLKSRPAPDSRNKPLEDPFRPPVNGLPRFNAWPLLQAYMLNTHDADGKRVDLDTIQNAQTLFNRLASETKFTVDREKLDQNIFTGRLVSGFRSPPTRAQLKVLLDDAARAPNGSWDRLIQAYLAIHAHALDRNDPVLTEALQEFAEFLADHAFTPNAEVQPAVIYDSPTLFRVLRSNDGTPPEPAWDEAQFQVLLQKLLTALSAN